MFLLKMEEFLFTENAFRKMKGCILQRFWNYVVQTRPISLYYISENI